MSPISHEFTCLTDSLKGVLARWPLLLGAAAIDLLFFIVFGFVWATIAYLAFPLIQQMDPSRGADNSYLGATVFGSEIFRLLIILYAAFVFLWIIFQGVNWWLAAKEMPKNQITYLTYLSRFCMTSLLSGLLVFIIVLLFLFFSLKSILTFSSPLQFTLIKAGAWIAVLAIAYFTAIAYASIARHSVGRALKIAWKKGATEWKPYLIGWMMVALGFVVIDLFLRVLYLGHPVLAIIGGIVTVFPLVSTVRNWMIQKSC